MEKEKHDFELRRKSFHIVLGSALAYFIYNNLIYSRQLFWILVAGTVLSLIVRKYRVPVIWQLLKFFERKEVIKTFPGKGTIFFFAGVLLTISLFPRDIAMASIMILTFGDSVSHLAGIYLGRTRSSLGDRKKLLEGTIAGIFTGFLAANLFVAWHEAFLASVGAMIAEVVELDLNKQPVDDNIIVPLAAGAIITLIRIYF